MLVGLLLPRWDLYDLPPETALPVRGIARWFKLLPRDVETTHRSTGGINLPCRTDEEGSPAVKSHREEYVIACGFSATTRS